MSRNFAYLAGLFDGEGTIGITVRQSNDCMNGNLYLAIGVGNTDKACCNLFASVFGGKVYLNKKATAKHKAYFWWSVSCKKAAWALQKLYPWLTIKRKQAEIAMEFAKHMANYRGRRITYEAALFRTRQREKLIRLHGNGSRAKHRFFS